MVGRTLVNGTKGGRGRRDNGWREVKGISAAFKKLAGNSLTSLGFRGAQCLNEFLDRTCSCWHLAYLHLTYFLPDHFHKFLLGSVRWLRTGWTGHAGKYYEWEENKKEPLMYLYRHWISLLSEKTSASCRGNRTRITHGPSIEKLPRLVCFARRILLVLADIISWMWCQGSAKQQRLRKKEFVLPQPQVNTSKQNLNCRSSPLLQITSDTNPVWISR